MNKFKYKYKQNPNWTKREQEELYKILKEILPCFKFNTFKFSDPDDFYYIVGGWFKQPDNLSLNLRKLSERYDDIWVEIKPKGLCIEYEIGLPPF